MSLHKDKNIKRNKIKQILTGHYVNTHLNSFTTKQKDTKIKDLGLYQVIIFDIFFSVFNYATSLELQIFLYFLLKKPLILRIFL